MADLSLNPDLVVVTYAKAKVALTFTPTDGNDDGLDLTNWTADFSIRSGSRVSPGAKLIDVTTANGKLVWTHAGSPVESTLTLTLTGSDMTVTPGQYYAELILTDPTGEPTFTGWCIWKIEPTMIGEA
jgi:hypothetical protein